MISILIAISLILYFFCVLLWCLVASCNAFILKSYFYITLVSLLSQYCKLYDRCCLSVVMSPVFGSFFSGFLLLISIRWNLHSEWFIPTPLPPTPKSPPHTLKRFRFSGTLEILCFPGLLLSFHSQLTGFNFKHIQLAVNISSQH